MSLCITKPENNRGEKAVKEKKLSVEEKHRLFQKYIVPNMASIKPLVKRYTDNYQDVDDNFNYCLTQFYNYIGSYDPKKKLDTWLHICVKRACFNQNKARAEQASHFTDIEMCSSEDIHQNGTSMVTEASFGALLDNLSDAVYKALMEIPPIRLSPLLLHIQGLRIREIVVIEWEMGHLEKRSEDMVKSRIFWAKLQLKNNLRKYGITGKSYQGISIDRDLDSICD